MPANQRGLRSPSKQWRFRFPSGRFLYGVWFSKPVTLSHAKQVIRERWQVERIPAGTKFSR